MYFRSLWRAIYDPKMTSSNFFLYICKNAKYNANRNVSLSYYRLCSWTDNKNVTLETPKDQTNARIFFRKANFNWYRERDCDLSRRNPAATATNLTKSNCISRRKLIQRRWVIRCAQKITKITIILVLIRNSELNCQLYLMTMNDSLKNSWTKTIAKKIRMTF